MREAQTDIRRCLAAGATVQIDFTEGRLSVKLDPSKELLDAFVDLNNRVLDGFTRGGARRRSASTPAPAATRTRRTAPTWTTRSCCPRSFASNVGNFFVQLASEADRPRVLKILGAHAKDGRRIFVGVTDPISPRVETAEEVRDRILEAAKFIDPGAPRLDRRLRLLALRRRHLDLARHRVRQDPRARRGQRDGVAGARV